MVAQFSHSPNDLQTFDIRNFADSLTPAKEKNKYICPACEGHNLSIEPQSGKYQCFNGCTNKEVRETIKPWSEVIEERKQGNYTPYSTPKQPKPAPIPTDNINIGSLPNPTAPEKIKAGENYITKYPYSNTQWVQRTDKPGGKKDFLPCHINSDGQIAYKKGDQQWLPYRIDEIIQYGAGKWAVDVEGEKCTDVARVEYQLLAFTFLGSASESDILQGLQIMKDAGIVGVIRWPDHDDTGYSKAKKCSEAAAKIGLPYVILDPLKIWTQCPHRGDIADFANAVAISGDELANLLKIQIKEVAQQSPKQNNVIPHPTLTKLSAKELKAKIENIIDKDLGKVETELELHDLAGTTNKPIRELRDLYNLIKTDKEQEQDKKDLEKIQLPKLFEAKKSRLDGFELLYGDGGDLAAMLHEQADIMPTAFEHLFSTLLPAVGSVIGTSSTIVINTSENYTQPCIFQSLILGKSGDLKSPTQRLIVKPLEELENIEREKYQKELEQYKEELIAFKKDPENNREPDKPNLKRYIVGALSQEAKIKLHCENPRGLLQLRDEWSGFISGRNKFRNGQGDDLELELSEFDGGSLRRDLVNSDNSAYIAKSAFNKTGNTQIETLRSILQKQGFDDHKGEFSRWLPSLVTVPFKELDLFAGDSGLSDRIQTSLRDLYIGCSQLPEKQYFLSIPAKKLCQDLISRLRQLNNETDDAGWNTIYPKIQGYLCRFILWIHLTNSVLAGNLNPDQMIDRQCVASAGKLVKFYLDQHLLLRALFTPEQKIEGDYLKIKDYLDRKACKKSIREIKAGVKGLRSLTTAEIKKMCDQMVNWGVLGIEEKTYYSVDFVDQNQQNVDLLEKKLNTPQPHTQQGVQDFEKNQNVDFVDLLLTNDQKAEPHTQQGLKAIKNSQNVDFVDPTPKNFQSPLVDHPDPTPVLIIDPTPDNSIFWGRSTNDDQNVPQTHTQQGVDPDTKRSTKSTNENYQTPEHIDGQGVAANQDFLEKVNKGQQRSTNEGQKYQIGDRINCYPTMEHESNKWKVKATIISIEYEQGYILTCTVSYKNRKKEDRTAVIAGGKSDDWLLGKA